MADKAEQRVLDDIAKFGWHLIAINPDEYGPGFVYSIGMMETLGHPEIIMFGLDRRLMATVINNIGRQVREGRNFAELGLFEDLLERYACKMIPVDERWHTEYLCSKILTKGLEKVTFGCIVLHWAGSLSPECRMALQKPTQGSFSGDLPFGFAPYLIVFGERFIPS